MTSIIRRGTAVGLTIAACAWIAGCDDSYLDQGPGRSQQPISAATLAEMEKLDTTPSSPTLIRPYKQEAELEIRQIFEEAKRGGPRAEHPATTFLKT